VIASADQSDYDDNFLKKTKNAQRKPPDNLWQSCNLRIKSIWLKACFDTDTDHDHDTDSDSDTNIEAGGWALTQFGSILIIER